MAAVLPPTKVHLLLAALVCTTAASATPPAATPFFSLFAFDSVTGRGIPRVTFTTTWEDVHVTDSAGYAAVPTAGLEGQRVWLSVSTDGYAAHADGFGLRGVPLDQLEQVLQHLELAVDVADGVDAAALRRAPLRSFRLRSAEPQPFHHSYRQDRSHPRFSQRIARHVM